jgi:hypothetical protein
MITDEEIDQVFAEFLDQPELSSWESDLSGREREDAQRLFREAVRKAISINEIDL